MNGIYAEPELYELACGYREVPAEVDALLRWYRRHASGAARPDPSRAVSVLELAAGPAEHALEFARRGFVATALDVSPAMCRWARQKARRSQLHLDVVQADMRDFRLTGRFALVVTMLNSACHLYTLDDFVAHLRAVARHTTAGGLYVLELTHPADHLAPVATTSTEWHVERDGVHADVRWGAGDVIDPVTQVTLEHVRITVRDESGCRTVTDVVPDRFWTATEVSAAVALAGSFTVVARYGDFADSVDLSAPSAWRMIVVLRRD